MEDQMVLLMHHKFKQILPEITPQAKTPTWVVQPQSASSAKIGSDNKVAAHNSIKVEGTADLSTSRVAPHVTTSKPFISQTTSGNLQNIHQHSQGMNFVQAPSLSNSHNEIGKIVQKVLQPQLPEHLTWTPPSRDYMNKALTCQLCKLTINEVESVLVCDACEKGSHLKCLQFQNQKGIPRGEWHCVKCLTLSNGKPLPPKYGRVMRNISAPKVSSSTPAVQSSPDKKVGSLDEKIHRQKIMANGNSCLQRICSNNVTETSSITSVSPAGSSVDRSCEKKLVSESKVQPPAKSSETIIIALDHLQASHNVQDNDPTGLPNSAEIPVRHCFDNNLMVKDSEKSSSRETLDCDPNCEIKQDELGVARANPVEAGTSVGAREWARSSSDRLRCVDWIGDVLQVVDEKTYYQSCCINGIVYKVQDHALFCSNNDKLVPSKLQAMWEDGKTRSKWVTINRCYFPGDLPEVVGRPCTPESNEVYESNHASTMMAGLIQGPCEVLPPGKFVEESERRIRLGTGTNDGLWPLFLCKWFYDKSKGLFRDVSSCGQMYISR
ncbi:hypothetical protein F0562_008754 [Nyssa sinensis]|uniref:PHD-type domain-containing protein n=1 Tax=Nyssa sinensis TaxID=561372 RepID=A0A5J5AC27_9ASTE|nr:hypothetical protein F0562_008754 [Nyssa sinensis]